MPTRSAATRPHAAWRAGLLACALGWASGAFAQGIALDGQLADSLAALPAPLVAPKPPLSTVVPSQVLRWRQEAQALEHGENGQPRDPARAATLYCQAAQHGDAEAQYSLGWMLTNSRGIERDDAQAAHLFLAAAEQGMPQAQRMIASMGTPLGDPPPCLKPPPIQPPVVVAAAAKTTPPRPRATRPVAATAPTAQAAPPAPEPARFEVIRGLSLSQE